MALSMGWPQNPWPRVYNTTGKSPGQEELVAWLCSIIHIIFRQDQYIEHLVSQSMIMDLQS
jgi:hypothetical protein